MIAQKKYLWIILAIAFLGAVLLMVKVDFLGAQSIPFSANRVGMVDTFKNPNITDPNNAGGGQEKIGGAIYALVNVMKYLVAVVAVLVLIISGYKLVMMGDEDDKRDEGKRGIAWGLLGLIFFLSFETVVVDVFYGGGFDTLKGSGEISTSISAAMKFLLSALEWFKAIVVIGAVGFLILSGWNLIFAFGDEETISSQKKVFLYVGVGFVVIALNEIAVQKIIYGALLKGDQVSFQPDAARGVSEIAGILRYFLMFLALIDFLAFLYGGAMMILAFGDEEKIGTGKKSLFGAAIGMVIIVISFAMVATITRGSA